MFFLEVMSAVILITFGQTEASLVSEPKCSKFHYEEEMLYKMVRVQHNMELLDIEFKKMGVQMEASTESNLKLREKIENDIERGRIELAVFKDDIKTEIQKEREDLVVLKGKRITKFIDARNTLSLLHKQSEHIVDANVVIRFSFHVYYIVP